nr:TPA_asm: m88.6 sORF 4 [Murid betaherpesvirus 1]DBA07847.1 TPA_asm: m88.6 sORF 4 [Murid betaherpesvirus 1]
MKMIFVVFWARKPRIVLKASFLMKCASSTIKRLKFCPRMLCVRKRRHNTYKTAYGIREVEEPDGVGAAGYVYTYTQGNDIKHRNRRFVPLSLCT